MGGTCSTGGKTEGKRSRNSLRQTCDDNIKMGLKVMCYEWVDWIQFAQDRLQWQALETR